MNLRRFFQKKGKKRPAPPKSAAAIFNFQKSKIVFYTLSTYPFLLLGNPEKIYQIFPNFRKFGKMHEPLAGFCRASFGKFPLKECASFQSIPFRASSPSTPFNPCELPKDGKECVSFLMDFVRLSALENRNTYYGGDFLTPQMEQFVGCISTYTYV